MLPDRRPEKPEGSPSKVTPLSRPEWPSSHPQAGGIGLVLQVGCGCWLPPTQHSGVRGKPAPRALCRSTSSPSLSFSSPPWPPQSSWPPSSRPRPLPSSPLLRPPRKCGQTPPKTLRSNLCEPCIPSWKTSDIMPKPAPTHCDCHTQPAAVGALAIGLSCDAGFPL